MIVFMNAWDKVAPAFYLPFGFSTQLAFQAHDSRGDACRNTPISDVFARSESRTDGCPCLQIIRIGLLKILLNENAVAIIRSQLKRNIRELRKILSRKIMG